MRVLQQRTRPTGRCAIFNEMLESPDDEAKDATDEPRANQAKHKKGEGESSEAAGDKPQIENARRSHVVGEAVGGGEDQC